MKVDNVYPYEYIDFYSEPSYGYQRPWPNWLLSYDPASNYGTIAGTKPRGYTAIFPENDGTVESQSVYLGRAKFNHKVPQYHYKGANDDEDECLPTSEFTEGIVKHWILDYHREPVISVDWIDLFGSGSGMGMLMWDPDPEDPVEQKGWMAHIHYYFYKTYGWWFDRYQGWSLYDGWFWYSDEWSSRGFFVDPRYYGEDETGSWRLKVKIHWPGDQYDTVLYSRQISDSPPKDEPDPGGCPELYSFCGTDTTALGYIFAQNNTILPHSEVILDTANDYLVFSNALPAQDSHYYLKIIENGTSTTYLDEIKLYAVDHAPGTQVATSSDGNTYVYSDVLPPNRCVSYTSEMLEDTLGNPVEYFYSVDHLEEVWYRDTLSFAGGDGESLFVSFPPTPSSWTNTGLLISTGIGTEIAPVPKNYCCIPYSEDGEGGWIPEDQVFARKKPSDWLVDVTPSAYMSAENGSRTFKIVCSADSLAYIDYIALVKLETSGWSMTEAPLDSALHWEYQYGAPVEGDAYGGLRYGDGVMAPYLEAGGQYALSFTALSEDTTKVRDFVLKTHGVYTHAYGPSSEVQEHGLLPGEYDLRVDQLMSSSRPAKICYQVAKAGRVGIQVIDVTGRQVTVLVDEYLEASSYTLDWNGRDARGQKLASGVYFIRMVSDEFAKNVKLVILD